MGDSTFSGFMGIKVSQYRKVKIRFFPGAKVRDMFHYTNPLLEKTLIMSFYTSVQEMHHRKLIQLSNWFIKCNVSASPSETIYRVKKFFIKKFKNLICEKLKTFKNITKAIKIHG